MKTAGVLMLLTLTVFCLFSDVVAQHGRESTYCSEYLNTAVYCTREYEPHCGTDRQTYGNKCAFCRAAARSNWRLGFQHLGRC
ncbi:serine protease inhibitor Kazal-type 6-like [Anolis sagrei]|uniref:serine protease inhibitor Kazal-type 6-like n=1 Tax=Anolis sagrei TaxID=38937 RepID=UPI003521007F